MPKTAISPDWLRIFKPKTDFFVLLRQQSELTLDGVVAFGTWIIEGALNRCQIVRDIEHNADELKLSIWEKLSETFVTPFDREDIYDLSMQLDEVLNWTKKAVREVEALEEHLDLFVVGMVQVLIDGTKYLNRSIDYLSKDLSIAKEASLLARKTETQVEKLYIQAMRELRVGKDFEIILNKRDLYTRMVKIAEVINDVGEKLLHIIIKMS